MKSHLNIPSHDHMVFLSQIRVLPNGCWKKGDRKLPKSYTPYRINGVQYNAHRISYELFNGPLIQGLVIDHICINRYCFNPEHLRQVTQKENLAENTRCERVNRIREKNECKWGHKLEGDNVIFFSRKNKDQKFRLCRECNTRKHKEKKLRRNQLCG